MSIGNTLFPIFLKLKQVETLIVGGGNVGLEKLEALLKNDPDARVVLVSPIISDKIRSLAAESVSVKLIQRKYRVEDLATANVAILATDKPSLHYRIRQQATKLGVLLNVADTPHLCDFYLGSTVKRGDLKVGISTNGSSPTFAKRFREVLEDILPENTHDLLTNLKKIRDEMKGDFSEKVKKLNRLTKTLVDKK
ncbi:MAG: bifunctional precorrin-2 dehydrogenase/sirohydrochlorin ferrochelatase [Cyclobacteriaceae bacterium]